MLAIAAPVASASPGTWTQLPQSERSAQGAQVSPLRLPDGSLVVAYAAQNADGVNADLLTALIGRTGSVAAAAPIVTGWSGTTAAALILQPGGIAAYFGGMHSGDSADPNQDLNVASAPGAGGPWTVAPVSVTATEGINDDQAYASDPSVVALGDGTPIEAWAHTLAVSVHRGIGPAQPNQDFQAAFGGCCGYDVDLAIDGAGAPSLAWYSGAAGHTGYYVQGIDPATGAPVGTPALVPGSQIGGTSSEPRAHTALTGRPGEPGLFTALAAGYPVQNRVILWRQGSPTSIAIAHDAGSVRNVALAADPAGRLWVIWTADDSGTQLFASRSNPAVTKFDVPVEVKLPGRHRRLVLARRQCTGGDGRRDRHVRTGPGRRRGRDLDDTAPTRRGRQGGRDRRQARQARRGRRQRVRRRRPAGRSDRDPGDRQGRRRGAPRAHERPRHRAPEARRISPHDHGAPEDHQTRPRDPHREHPGPRALAKQPSPAGNPQAQYVVSRPRCDRHLAALRTHPHQERKS